jgi:hypothetical protein
LALLLELGIKLGTQKVRSSLYWTRGISKYNPIFAGLTLQDIKFSSLSTFDLEADELFDSRVFLSFYRILTITFSFSFSSPTEGTMLPLPFSPSPPLICGSHVLGFLQPLDSLLPPAVVDLHAGLLLRRPPRRSSPTSCRRRPLHAEDHVWFEDRWMVASLCDEWLTTLCRLILG